MEDKLGSYKVLDGWRSERCKTRQLIINFLYYLLTNSLLQLFNTQCMISCLFFISLWTHTQKETCKCCFWKKSHSQSLGYVGKKKNHPYKAVFSSRVSQWNNSNHSAVCLHRAMLFLIPVYKLWLHFQDVLLPFSGMGQEVFFSVCANISQFSVMWWLYCWKCPTMVVSNGDQLFLPSCEEINTAISIWSL